MATYEEEMLKKAQLENENGNQAQTSQQGSTSTAQQTQAGLMQSAPSANVMSAQKYLDSLVKGESPNYQSGYAPQIKQLYDQVMNRGEFAYDVNKDPLYQQLRSQHINNGRLAMEDTIAQATGLSGGYGNTFAQAAGQQQYNQHMQQLTGYIPQLRAQAQQEWAAEGDALQNQLAMAQQMDAAEYDRFRNEVNDLWNNMQFDFQKEQNVMAQRESAFNQAIAMMQAGMTPSEELIAMAGITADDVAAYQKKLKGSGGTATVAADGKKNTFASLINGVRAGAANAINGMKSGVNANGQKGQGEKVPTAEEYLAAIEEDSPSFLKAFMDFFSK